MFVTRVLQCVASQKLLVDYSVGSLMVVVVVAGVQMLIDGLNK